MIFTFYKARGMAVGSSLGEEDKLDLAKKLEEAAKAKGVEFILPTDVVIADKFDENANHKVVSASEIPDGWMVRFSPTPSVAWAAHKTIDQVSTKYPCFGQPKQESLGGVACQLMLCQRVSLYCVLDG